MEFLGANLSSLVQITKTGTTNDNNTLANVSGLKANPLFLDDPACTSIPDIFKKFSGFDMTMDHIAAFKDILSVAQDNLGLMREQGQSILDLINRAKEEDCSEESLDAIQAEVDARLAKIREIRDNANFNGVNPFDGAISLGVKNWQEIFGLDAEDKEAAKNEITDMLASFDIDMNIDGGFFNLGGTATINIGYNENGELQITVDTAFDFDLSGLEELGVKDENAYDLINNFLALLTGQQNGMNNASNFIDSLVASASASIVGDGFKIDATNDINLEGDSSKSLQGQIVQHAAITLASSAYHTPSIAINIL